VHLTSSSAGCRRHTETNGEGKTVGVFGVIQHDAQIDQRRQGGAPPIRLANIGELDVRSRADGDPPSPFANRWAASMR
jgi:hypothetical protein